MRKLFTIRLGFSDHLEGVYQCEADSPLDALIDFFKSSECLESYDRQLVTKSLEPLVQVADMKGV